VAEKGEWETGLLLESFPIIDRDERSQNVSYDFDPTFAATKNVSSFFLRLGVALRLRGLPDLFLARNESAFLFGMATVYFSSASFCVAICPASLLGLSFLICS
jgi:hypothetical protein